ncbi:MAG TPA: hypothetical protein VIL92_00120 [Gaiellaceae bacterium]
MARPLALLKLAHRVHRDLTATSRLSEEHRERPQQAAYRPAFQPRAPFHDDESRNVVAGDLVKPALAKVRDQVAFDRPPIAFTGARPDLLTVEPGASALVKPLGGPELLATPLPNP